MKSFIVSEKREIVPIAQLEIRYEYLINISAEELRDMVSTWLQEIVPDGDIEVQVNPDKDLRFIVHKPRGILVRKSLMDYTTGIYVTVKQLQKSYSIKCVGEINPAPSIKNAD